MKRAAFVVLLLIAGLSLFTLAQETTAGVCPIPKGARVAVVIPETIINWPIPDPAAETEIIQLLINAGYNVVDQSLVAPLRYSQTVQDVVNFQELSSLQAQDAVQNLAQKLQADYLIVGQAVAAYASNNNGLWVMRARVEIRVIRVSDNTIVLSYGAESTGQDTSEQLAGKDALSNAGLIVGRYILHPTPIKQVLKLAVTNLGVSSNLSVNFDLGGRLSQMISDALIQQAQNSPLKGKIQVMATGKDLKAVLNSIQSGNLAQPNLLIAGQIVNLNLQNIGTFNLPIITMYINNLTYTIHLEVLDGSGAIIWGNDYSGSMTGKDAYMNMNGISSDNFNGSSIEAAFTKVVKEAVPDIMNTIDQWATQTAFFAPIVTTASATQSSSLQSQQFSFKLNDGMKIVGTFITQSINVQTAFFSTAIAINSIESITANPDGTFTIVSTNGSNIVGKITDPSFSIKTDFNPSITIPWNEVQNIKLED